MFEWLSLPLFKGLTISASLLLAAGLQAAESEKSKRKPCQMKDGSWMECRAEENQVLPTSDYALRLADKAKKSKSPLVLIAGGPGQAAREAFIPMPQMIDDLSPDFDLIFFNPRGTASPAKLACPLPETLDLAPISDRTKLIARAKDCLKSLGASFDLNDFGTDQAARDLDQIREELSYDKISLYAVSYGTRVALRYAALFPHRVDKLVLEGVLPPEAFIGQDTYALEPVLQSLAKRCQSTPLCTKAYGDVWDSYQKLRTDFAKARTVNVKHPRSGRSQSISLDIGTIEGLLLHLLYTEFDQTLIPAIIHQASGGNLDPLIASSFTQARQGVYEGLYFAIACTEDAPFYDSTKLNPRTEELIEICLSYPFKPTSAPIHAPVKGPWPTLLLSGELDPVTPPALVETLKSNLSNARQLVLPGKGHNVFYLRCVAEQIKGFLRGKPAKQDCEGKNRPLPFYIEESKR